MHIKNKTQSTASSQTNSSCGDQRPSTIIKRQVHSEQHIAAVAIQIHGEIDSAPLTLCALLRMHPPNLRRPKPDRRPIIQDKLVRRPRRALERQPVNNKRTRVIHPFNIKPQAQRLQTPLLPVRDRLPRRGDIRLGEEKPSEPHFKIVQASSCVADLLQLRETPRQVRDPCRDRHRFVNLVAPPVGWDRA